MKNDVTLTTQQAKLIVRALYELGDERKFHAVDRLNRMLAESHNLNLGKIRMEECTR